MCGGRWKQFQFFPLQAYNFRAADVVNHSAAGENYDSPKVRAPVIEIKARILIRASSTVIYIYYYIYICRRCMYKYTRRIADTDDVQMGL